MALDWEPIGALVLITLTYPGKAGALFVPQDGRIVHAHLRSFLKRWKRQWGQTVGLWKLEFQRRGAPHLHLFLASPGETSVTELRAWVARIWWDVVGSGDTAHLRAGTGVERWEGTPTRYAWKYVKGDPAKERQHQVPDGFTNIGRWWGFVNLRPRWLTIDLPGASFVTARRMLRRWRRATSGYRVRLVNSTAGFWLFVSQGTVSVLVAAVMRAALVGREEEDACGS